MGAIFIWLSGASRKILRECPTERPKFYGLGAIIVVTGGMAGVSLAFALVNALKVSLRGAVVFAVLWAIAVMMIDRMFVASMHRQRNPFIYLVQALPRLAMAVVLGFVISTPFVLQIFKPEITNQVAKTQAAERTAYFHSLDHDPLANTVKQDQTNLTNLQDTAKSGGAGINISADPTLQGMKGQLANAQSQLTHWTDELNCQLYGGAAGGIKCVRGYGPVAGNDQQQVNTWQAQVNTLNSEIKGRTDALQAQSTSDQNAQQAAAQKELGTAQQTLKNDQDLLTRQNEDRTNGIQGDSGILAQLAALNVVTAGNPTLQAARLLLFLLFLIIDILPVFTKILLNLMPASTYDKILAEEETSYVQAAEDSRAVRRAQHRAATQAEAAGMRQRNTAWTSPLPGQHDAVIAMRQRVNKAWLKRREAELLRDIANGQGLIGSGSQPGFDDWHPSWPQWRPGGARPRPPRRGGASPAGQGPSGPGQQPPSGWPRPPAEPEPASWASTQPVPSVTPLPMPVNGGGYRPEPWTDDLPVTLPVGQPAATGPVNGGGYRPEPLTDDLPVTFRDGWLAPDDPPGPVSSPFFWAGPDQADDAAYSATPQYPVPNGEAPGGAAGRPAVPGEPGTSPEPDSPEDDAPRSA